MRILIYKRTHTGDPNEEGVFGINDCMGKVRGYRYDAVVGVGGLGREPRAHGIDGLITWIGINPTRHAGGWRRGPLVTFEHFFLFDQDGPSFNAWTPRTADRIYGGKVRFIIDQLDGKRESELGCLLEWAATNKRGLKSSGVKRIRGFKVRCTPCPSKSRLKSLCRRQAPNSKR